MLGETKAHHDVGYKQNPRTSQKLIEY